MAYLEELLPEFRKGTKIRMNDWEKGSYICLKDEDIVDEDGCVQSDELDSISYWFFNSNWELYQETEPDWQYIMDNKCLCWFWNNDNEGIGNVGILSDVCQEMEYPFTSFYQGNKFIWKFCRPVYRNEVIFYNNKQ